MTAIQERKLWLERLLLLACVSVWIERLLIRMAVLNHNLISQKEKKKSPGCIYTFKGKHVTVLMDVDARSTLP